MSSVNDWGSLLVCFDYPVLCIFLFPKFRSVGLLTFCLFKEDQRLKSQSIVTLSSATTTHRSLLAREQSEKEEMNTAIRSLENTHAAHGKTRDRLKSQIAQTQRQVDSKLQAQRDYNAKLESQSRLNGPELAFWETFLGVRLEGAGVLDRIKVVFTLEGGRNGGKSAGPEDTEAWFELDLGQRDYEVRCMGGAVEIKDMLRVEKVLDKLNETRDIGQFLAGMRGLFLEEMKA